MILLGASGHCLALMLLCVVVASCHGQGWRDYETDEMDRGFEFDRQNFEYARRRPAVASWFHHIWRNFGQGVNTCPEKSTPFGKCANAWSTPGTAALAKETAALELRRRHHHVVFNPILGQPARQLLDNLSVQFKLDSSRDPEWAKTYISNLRFAQHVATKVVPPLVPGIKHFSDHGKVMNAFQGTFMKHTPVAAKYRPWNRSAEADPQLLLNDRWNDDRVFAASRLAGFNPVNIYRIGSTAFSRWHFFRRINSDFKWDSAVLQATGGHCNFWMALLKGQLFVQYHTILRNTTNDPAGAGAFKGKKFLTPLVLFVLPHNSKELKVVAIQLGEGAKGKVYSPSTSSFFWWTYAKAVANNANAIQNHLQRHLHNAHFVSERFVMATERELSPSHPVRQLLQYHYRGLHQVNSFGSIALTSPGGATHRLLEVGFSGTVHMLKESFRHWHYRDMNLEEDAKWRGVDTLPHYPYLEDGREFVKVLRHYVDGYVRLHYCCDNQVRDDKALQRWVHYSAVTVLKGTKGLPTRLETMEELVSYITNQLWVLTGYHAAVNYANGDYDFSPYTPFAIFLRPDQVDKTLAAATSPENLDYITSVVGGLSQSLGTWALGYSLAGFKFTPVIEDSELIRSSHRGPLVHHTQAAFRKLEVMIEERNRFRRREGLLPYRFLLPSEVTGGIAI